MLSDQDNLGPLFRAVCRVTGVPRVFLRRNGRQPLIVHGRAVAIRVMRKQMGMTWKQIGSVLDRSHSSVIELHRDHKHDAKVIWDAAAVSETLDLKNQPLATGGKNP